MTCARCQRTREKLLALRAQTSARLARIVTARRKVDVELAIVKRRLATAPPVPEDMQ